MIISSICLLNSILYIILMTIYIGPWYLVFVWLICAIFLFYFQAFILMMLYTLLFTRSEPFGKFKSYLFYEFAWFCKTFMANVKYEYKYLEKLPKEISHLVISSNHKSKVDPMVYPILFKGKAFLSFTPKSDLYKYPFLKHWLKGLRSIKVDRNNDRNTVKELIKGIEYAKKGLVYIVYPEGGIKTREYEQMVPEIKHGVFKLALKGNCDILITAIINSRFIRKNFPFKRTKVTLLIGDTLKFNDIKDMTTIEIGNLVRDKTNLLIDNYLKESGEKVYANARYNN